MKTEFKLNDSHSRYQMESHVRILKPSSKNPFVQIETGEGDLLYVDRKDLEQFAVNILKSLKSKKLK